MNHDRNMHPERMAFLRAIDAAPRDRTTQLVFADWLAEHGEPRAEQFWRVGRGGLVGLAGLAARGGLAGLAGLGGLVGRGGLAPRGGRGGLRGLAGLGGRGGRGGLAARGGRGGLPGLVGLVGLAGRGGLFNPEGQIVLIPGERALIFLPHGYGCAVLVGYVKVETPVGWIVEPCREVLDTHNGDCWVELAAGHNPELRSACTFGPLIEDGMRVPTGCFSMRWQGDLPE